MVAKLSLNDLPADVRDAIARGETVCVYDKGEVAATMVPESEDRNVTRGSGIVDYRQAMDGVLPLDDGFEGDISATLAAVLKPQHYPWE
ncbi:MAG TPA: hypothetical protein PKD27_04270 [Tepidiformaceae bacterium]|nr:hypothetical protein [Tepidiformaceae bacterium]